MKTHLFVLLCLLLAASGYAGDKPGEISAAEYDSIQEAIDANPGRMIYLPSGDYVISEKLHLHYDHGGLFGPGRIIQTDPAQPVIQIKGASDVRISELTLTRPEGKMETHEDALVALKCRDLVLENLRVLDNRSPAAAISVRNCDACQIRGCLVRNYMCISVDDRTASADWGYAFNCIDGSGISVVDCEGALIQGNRVLEDRMLPTSEIQKQFALGQFVKKNAEKGAVTNQQMWDESYTNAWHQGSGIVINSPERSDCTQVLGNYIQNAAQGMDIHSDHVIVSQNIVNNAFIGMKAMHGSRHVLIIGNQFMKNDLWSIGLMPGAASHRALPAHGGKPASPANVDGGSIIANNIISDFGYGHAHWMWGDEGDPIRFDHGQKPDNPPLSDVIIQGNMIYDTGRDQIIVGGEPKVEPPRYKYAVRIEGGPTAPKELHFSNNILHPGLNGVSNIKLAP